MSNKFDLARVVVEAEPGSEGFAHALNLLVLAIRRTNPSVGPLLDEFTSMHADYLRQLRALPPDAPERTPLLAAFQVAARQIYQRLSELQAEQSTPLASVGMSVPMRLH
jgi:hypothetical protein